MKQIAIIGLSYFGKNVVEELIELDADILLIDKDREVIDAYKDAPVNAVALNVIDEDSLRHVLPSSVDAVVIDLGSRVESSILVTSYCRKLGIKTIVVKAETEEHAEILELVGATKVVFPNREAAKRITPLLVSSALLNYLPVSGKLVIAEIAVPDQFIGQTVIEAEIRRKHSLNLISVKSGLDEEYELINPGYRFQTGDIALVSGSESDLEIFAGASARAAERGSVLRNLKRLFHAGNR